MSYLHVYLNTIANICDSKKKQKKIKKHKQNETARKVNNNKKQKKTMCIVKVLSLKLS